MARRRSSWTALTRHKATENGVSKDACCSKLHDVHRDCECVCGRYQSRSWPAWQEECERKKSERTARLMFKKKCKTAGRAEVTERARSHKEQDRAVLSKELDRYGDTQGTRVKSD